MSGGHAKAHAFRGQTTAPTVILYPECWSGLLTTMEKQVEPGSKLLLMLSSASGVNLSGYYLQMI